MAYLKAVGQWLEGSGWTDSLVDAGLVGSGTADSFLKAAHVTRTRRAHEVTACALQMLLTQSYQGYMSDLPGREEPCSMESWCINQADGHPTFKYWSFVLEMELTLLLFVRSFREGNFELYLQSLIQMAPWFFLLTITTIHGGYPFTSGI